MSPKHFSGSLYGSEKVRADSGISSLLNSLKACLEFLYWSSAYEK